ncbi:MAG: hypothetical protein ACOC3I_08030, partial [Verrucomicrobiota bacterium]
VDWVASPLAGWFRTYLSVEEHLYGFSRGLFELSARDGSFVREKVLGTAQDAFFMVDAGLVFVDLGDHLAAIDRETFEVVWEEPRDPAFTGLPSLIGDRLFRFNGSPEDGGDGHIEEIDALNGRLLRRIHVPEQVPHRLIVTPNAILARGVDNTFLMDRARGVIAHTLPGSMEMKLAGNVLYRLSDSPHSLQAWKLTDLVYHTVGIRLNRSAGGRVSLSRNPVVEGERVTATIEANPGFLIEHIDFGGTSGFEGAGTTRAELELTVGEDGGDLSVDFAYGPGSTLAEAGAVHLREAEAGYLRAFLRVGHTYQLRASLDMVEWFDYAGPVVGDDQFHHLPLMHYPDLFEPWFFRLEATSAEQP